MKELIIFDWGRTLHDNDKKDLFEATPGILKYLSGKYTLAIVSIAKSEDIEDRWQVIDHYGLRPLFASIMFVSAEEKNAAYERSLTDLGFGPQQTWIVDDRTVRGIAWGNRRGAKTIWLCKGKFAHELPNAETGQPTHTIHDLSELYQIL